MKLLSVALARSVWLFDMNDLNPTGKSLVPLLRWVAEQYNFQTVPKSWTDLDPESKGLLFKNGQFKHGDDGFSVNVGVYTDGLSAESWASTDITDKFLEDVLRSAADTFGLAYSPESVRTKRYVSELIVNLEAPLGNLNTALDRFYKTLNDALGVNAGPYELSGVAFAFDASQSSYKPPHFIIERRADTPFSQKRYFSRSSLPTSRHLKVIEEFEKLLA